MNASIHQIYQQSILPLSEREQLKLAALIINKICAKTDEDTQIVPTNEKLQTTEHPLTTIRKLAVDVGMTDLAERHDFYAHGKLED